MPHRPPKKIKKASDPQSDAAKASQLAEQRRREMSTRSHLTRFQNRSSDRK